VSVTTEQLLALAKEGADLTNVADYVTNATWLSWLNDGKTELHRFVTNKFKATYYRPYDFTLSSTSQQTLPANFWRLKGLDIDPDTSRRREVRPNNFAERNNYRQNSVRDPLRYCTDRHYNLLGSRLLLIQPQENAAGDYRLYYVPKPKTLALVRSVTVLNTDAVVAATRTWTFANGAFGDYQAGDQFAISGTDNGNDGTYTIESVTGSETVVTVEDPAANETFDGTETMSVTTCLDEELEPYSEYVWLTAALKSLAKEESTAQFKLLWDQRNLIRNDLTESLETDQGGPATIIDTDDDGEDLW
jgi:hypothetical protein